MPVALLSVSAKSGVAAFAAGLRALGWRIVSTGGTAAALRAAGLEVSEVSARTGAPEVLDGRVKTLHPAVFAGVLARGPADAADLARVGAEPIDLVAVDLYPFAADPRAETIDVGGHALLRAAAKASDRVLAVSSPGQYDEVLEALRSGDDLAPLRRRLAAEAWRRVAAYDAAIAAWAAEERFPETAVLALRRAGDVRYGENPHQAGAWYRLEGLPGLHDAEVLGGKPLSANNLCDVDAAAAGVRALGGGAVVVKHATPCGAALGATAAVSAARALRCDPESAFGGVVAVGAPVDAAAAEALVGVFLECLAAPAFDAAALEALRRRKNLRILRWPGLLDAPRSWRVRSVSGGLVADEPDETPDSLARARVATRRAPTEAERAAIETAWRVARVARSNAVVLAWAGEAAGIGAGAVSRVDAARAAAAKCAARRGRGGVPDGPLAAASDAFLPFPDSLEVLAEAGATAVVQSGGSVRDAEVVAAADRLGLAMLLTGVRHFRH